MRRALFVVLPFVLAFAAGCGGGSGGAIPARGTAPSAHLEQVKLNVDAPASSSAARPQYISAATTQATIDIQQSGTSVPGYPQTVALTPTSGGCTSSLASTYCQLTLALAPGSYTLYLTAKDANGVALSAALGVPFTVVAGTANNVNVALGGVPAAVQILPAPSSSIGVTDAAALTYGDCVTPQRVNVVALDADGNYIFGPGAPALTLTSDDTAHLTVASQGASTPNAFTLSCPLGTVPWGNTMHLVATATPSGMTAGSPLSATVPVTFYRAITGTFSAFPTFTTTNLPLGLAIAPDGEVWFSNRFAQALGVLNYDGSNFRSIAVSTIRPEHATFGPDGAYWFLDIFNSQVGRVRSDGTVASYGVTAGGLDQDSRIVTGPDGALWFSEESSGLIGRVTTSGTVTEYPVPTSASGPSGMAVGPDGALWFAEQYTQKIGRITTSGTVTEYSVAPSCPLTVAFAPDGALWFGSSCNAYSLGRMTTDGTLTNVYENPSAHGSPQSMTVGPDGMIWFIDGGGDVRRIDMNGGVSSYSTTGCRGYNELVPGRDGSLWYDDPISTSNICRLR